LFTIRTRSLINTLEGIEYKTPLNSFANSVSIFYNVIVECSNFGGVPYILHTSESTGYKVGFNLNQKSKSIFLLIVESNIELPILPGSEYLVFFPY